MQCYLFNSISAAAVLCAVFAMFFVQFKVEKLNKNIQKHDAKIANLQDDIKVLEVEWVYLTRPERLRMLSKRYLKDNIGIAANQVKNRPLLANYYAQNLAKSRKKLAMK